MHTPSATHTATKRPWRDTWALLKAWDLDALTDRELYQLMACVLLLLAAALTVIFTVINPPPARTLVMSTGAKAGGYYAMALRYQKALKAHGVTLEIVESKGSLQNLERLRNAEMVGTASGKQMPVMAAFVQSGTHLDADLEEDKVESLASVANEPIWVFHKLSSDPRRLADLRGKRIGVDVSGSGSQFASKKLLAASGVDAQNSSLLEVPAADALAAITAGQADAVMMVAASASPLIKKALSEGFQLMPFDQADGLVRKFPWLRRVVIPRGVMDLAQDLPKQDVTLVAASANLVVSTQLHPSLAFLLMDVAHDLHAPASAAQAQGEFPSQVSLTLNQSAESKRYFVSGRPFLQKYLPFWLANWAERLLAGVVPVLLLALPLLKAIPSFISWRETAHLSRTYLALREVENGLQEKTLPPAEALVRLDALQAELKTMEASSSHLGKVFETLAQVNTLRDRVHAATLNAGAGQAAA